MRGMPRPRKVTVRYVNREGGKKFGLKGVWTGAVGSNEVVFTVP